MIVEFSVGNFKSIRKTQTISLIAAPIVAKDERIDENNVFESPVGTKLLKVIGLYGANASGKSNLIKAFMRMMIFISNSFQNENEIERIEPFALTKDSEAKPIYFQLTFIANGQPYRYGFEIQRGKVKSEWLFGPAKKNEVEYFTRIGDEIKVNKTSFKEGESVPKGVTRSSTLFLNVVHAFNGPIAKEIKNFFAESVIITTGINDASFRDSTNEMLKRANLRDQIIDFVKAADFGIDDVMNVEVSENDIARNSLHLNKPANAGGKYEMVMSMRGVSGDGKQPKLFMPFDLFESEGTKKFFTYAGPIIEALQHGLCLVIDEFDARLHPSLTRKIVELFSSKDSNKKNAQLIFVTHDTNLLDAKLLRRDQVYFAEKNKNGESSFYSLVNIGGVRNDASIEKDYLKGKYGAVPYLSNLKLNSHGAGKKN
jgi:hypothetical protein